ncbi:hypothetical protein M3223_14710 [Paenibacillus pasadenensis]|uniref:hypothetical protein n=1 Tax=Paenibacillus pasadenensis TaxID=217090 RepID=UPI002040E858|nr:hypothetical protein [Paenibacillus pasadenensis]MCM3748600.1 hypothetical protein [Paenibacillus pasadenensis]
MPVTSRDEPSSNNKKSFGIVLVLFILAVIASRIFYRSAQGKNPQQDNPAAGIDSLVLFYIYNESDFTLTVPANGLFGDFEPKPPGHTIRPNGSYIYQVSTAWYKTSIATIYYSYEYQDAGQARTGNYFVDLIVNTNGTGGSMPGMRLYITGPISYYWDMNFPATLYIRN